MDLLGGPSVALVVMNSGWATMSIPRTVVLALLVLMLGDAVAEEVPPGFMYRGPLLNVQSPKSEGWSLLGTSSQGMAFARPGEKKGSSFGAQVLPFDLPEPEGKDEFVELIRQAVKADTADERFVVIEESYEYTEERGYPCVRSINTIDDEKAKVSMFRKTTMKLQTYSLYCQHPGKDNFGFAAIYSYRGPQVIGSLKDEAESFIGGVQVPEN